MLQSLLKPILTRLRHRRLYLQAGLMARRLQEVRRMETRFVSMKTDQPRRGRVLLSYIVDPFLMSPDDPAFSTHTNYWESLQMAKTWLAAGYDVDAIHWTNTTFRPMVHYDVCIDVRHNLERLAPLLGPQCLKIMHCETAHWLFHTTAHHRRLLDLQQRRHVTLLPDKIIEANRAIDVADCATILGNSFTQGTFSYAGKPLYHVPIATLHSYPWPAHKDFEASRRRFLWFGSSGLVHKGLDLALEAFAGLPDHHLTVCGPIEGEREFVRTYQAELYQRPNIKAIGWVDVSGAEFQRIADSCLGLVYPTSSEGASGSTVTCMHKGLIPIASYQSGINITEDYGIVLSETTIATIRDAIQRLSELPADQLQAMAKRAWEFAQANHTRERFATEYRKAVDQILATQPVAHSKVFIGHSI